MGVVRVGKHAADRLLIYAFSISYFMPSALAILDNQGNQYETSYGGTLDQFSQIYPGVKKTGYILFENVLKSAQSLKLVFQLGHDESYDPYNFEYNLPVVR